MYTINSFFFKERLSKINKRTNDLFRNSCLLFVVCCCFGYAACVNTPCNDYGPTLSNINECNSGVCTYTEVLTDNIDLLPSTRNCYRFTSPDNTVDTAEFTVSIVFAYYKYRSDYHYNTGDTSVNVKGKCGCPLGSSFSCSNCDLFDINDGTITCTDGVHQDSDCTLNKIPGAHGTYCLEAQIRSTADIHVNHYVNSPAIVAYVTVSFNGTEWVGEYLGDSDLVIENEQFSFTIRSFNAVPAIIPEFSVWDTYITEKDTYLPRLYLLNRDFVNDINTCEINKIGWYKPFLPSPLCEDFNGLGTPLVENCDHNEFLIHRNFTSSPALLNRLSQYDHRNINPDIFIKDPIYPDLQFKNTTFHTGFRDSTIFYSENGTLTVYGWGDDGYPLPSPSLSLTTFTINYGAFIGQPTYNGAYVGCSPLIESGSKYFIYSLTDFVIEQKNICVIPEGSIPECVSDTDGGCPFESVNCLTTYIDSNQCQSVTTEAVIWPDFRKHNVSFFTRIFVNETFDIDASYITDTVLFSPIVEGSLEYSVSMKNFTVTYNVDNIKPSIKNVEYSESDGEQSFVIVAKSLTVAGRCYVESHKLFLIPQPIDLITSFLSFQYSIQVNEAVGDFDISIHCGLNKATASLSLNINNTFIPTDSNTDSVSWEDAATPWKLDFGHWEDLSTAQTIVKVIILAIILIVIVSGIIILAPIIAFLGFKSWMVIKVLCRPIKYLYSKSQSLVKNKPVKTKKSSNKTEDLIQKLISS